MAALAVSGWRWQRRVRYRRRLADLPGGSRTSALAIDDFADIDAHLAARRCPCGGTLASLGERSEPDGQRVLRVARVECRLCEERGEVWFDASRAYH